MADKMMEQLSSILRPDEIEVLKEVLSAVKKSREDSKSAKLIRKIVPIQEWVEDEYYVGPAGLGLYPEWKKEMIDIFRSDRAPEDRISEIIITGPLGCRPWNTLYHTDIGTYTLSELAIKYRNGERFKVKNEHNEWVNVVNVHNVGSKKTKKVQFSNGHIMEATVDHRVRVLNKGKLEWCRFDELTPESNVLYCEVEEGKTLNDYDLDKAYLMGYVYGDGWFTYNNGNSEDVSVVGVLYPLDGSQRNYIKNIAEKYIGGKEHPYKKGETLFGCVRATNRELCSEWGIGNSHTKTLPNWMLNSNKEVISRFLSGLFDSDGHIGSDTIELTLANKILIEQVSYLLSQFGIQTVITRYESKTRMHIQGKRNWTAFNNLVDLKVDYKAEKLKALSETPYSRNDRTILYSLREYISEELKVNKVKITRKNKSFENLRYNKQEVTLELLKRFREVYPEWCVHKETITVLTDTNSRIIRPILIEDGECICGDIEVDGHIYVNDGIINHNTGKSTVGLFCMIRRLYELSCYENVNALFNLMPGSITALVYLSLNRTQAEMTGLGNIRTYIDTIPYFREKFPRNDRLQSILSFPEKIILLAGSDQGHFIGMNMIGCILDEANFRVNNAQDAMRTSSDNSKVSNMYASIVNRGKSRFLVNGVNNSLSILISSSTTGSSFTEQRLRQVEGHRNVKVLNKKLWEVKPKGTYSETGFWVFIGSDTLDATICDVPEDIYTYTDMVNLPRYEGTVEEIIKQLPDYHKEVFTWVPDDFRNQYEDNLYMSLQDVSGIPVAPSGRLFNSRPAYRDACNSRYEPPFTKPVFTLATQDSFTVRDYIKRNYRPFCKDKPRYGHVDQSLSHDRTGVASVFLDSWVMDEKTGIYKPSFVCDMLMSVSPPKAPRKISISKCTDIWFYMRDKWGLTVDKVTYDSFGSESAIQDLEANGFNAGYLSVDKSDEQYLFLVECLLEGRLKMYYHPVFEKELFDLIHYREKRKVDHPPVYYSSTDNTKFTGGSKDLTDAVAGALWNCYIENKDNQSRVQDNDSRHLGSFDDEDEEDFSLSELTGMEFISEDEYMSSLI